MMGGDLKLANHFVTASNERHQNFVGRKKEITSFIERLHKMKREDQRSALLHYYGPTGSGKTSFLRECEYLTIQEQKKCLYLSLEFISTGPEELLRTFATVLDLPDSPTIHSVLNQLTETDVLLLDCIDSVYFMEQWLREHFFCYFPTHLIVVLASQRPLPTQWSADLYWSKITASQKFQSFNKTECKEFLIRRGLSLDYLQDLFDLSLGYPIAVSLGVESLVLKSPLKNFNHCKDELIDQLFGLFIKSLTSSDQRQTLQIAAEVRTVTPSILQNCLKDSDALLLYQWLSSLSFVENLNGRLRLHDLVRKLISLHLNLNDSGKSLELRDSIKKALFQQKKEGQYTEETLADLLFLHRNDHGLASFFHWEQERSTYADRIQADDIPVVLEIIRKFEGEVSEKLARFWMNESPESWIIFRRPDGSLEGFTLMLNSKCISKLSERSNDPAILVLIKSKGPSVLKSECLYFRFWMTRDQYQSVSPIQSEIFIHIVAKYLSTPNLAYSFVVCSNCHFWRPTFEYANIHQSEALSFQCEDHPYGVFMHDWKKEPVQKWLHEMGSRGQTPTEVPADEVSSLPPENLLKDLKLILKHYNRADRIEKIIQSSLIKSVDSKLTADRIQTLIRKALEEMEKDEKDCHYSDTVFYTFIERRKSQEETAEYLGLSFSTYRRYLEKGVYRLAQLLSWTLGD